MADKGSGESSRVPPILDHPPAGIQPLTDGRCHWCGYQLRGLPGIGNCPECGKAYTPQSAAKLKPWPGAFMICIRLGWPLLGLVLAGLVEAVTQQGFILIYGYPMLLAVPINSYLQVRSLLKKHLPEQRRTAGTIAGLRAMGTVIAAIVLLLTLAPLLLFGACLIIMASGGF